MCIFHIMLKYWLPQTLYFTLTPKAEGKLPGIWSQKPDA